MSALSQLTTNEKLTLLLSGMAFLVSFAAILIGQLQQNRQAAAAAREHFNGVINQLIDSQREASIIDSEYRALGQPSPNDGIKYNILNQSLNHKMTTLARQASELLNNGAACSDVELIAIANALDNSGDIVRAEALYRRAIDRSSSLFYRSINIGLLADQLMRRGETAEGRKLYGTSVSLMPNDSDYHRASNGRTYLAWMIAEMSFVPPPNARVKKCFELSEALYKQIAFQPLREARLAELRDALGSYPVA